MALDSFAAEAKALFALRVGEEWENEDIPYEGDALLSSMRLMATIVSLVGGVLTLFSKENNCRQINLAGKFLFLPQIVIFFPIMVLIRPRIGTMLDTLTPLIFPFLSDREGTEEPSNVVPLGFLSLMMIKSLSRKKKKDFDTCILH